MRISDSLDRLARIRDLRRQMGDMEGRMNMMNEVVIYPPGSLRSTGLVNPETVYVLPVERICKNCKWWAINPEMKDGICSNHKLYAGIIDKVGAWDDGLAGGEIVTTGPRFGCLHFEVAPEDEPK